MINATIIIRYSCFRLPPAHPDGPKRTKNLVKKFRALLEDMDNGNAWTPCADEMKMREGLATPRPNYRLQIMQSVQIVKNRKPLSTHLNAWDMLLEAEKTIQEELSGCEEFHIIMYSNFIGHSKGIRFTIYHWHILTPEGTTRRTLAHHDATGSESKEWKNTKYRASGGHNAHIHRATSYMKRRLFGYRHVNDLELRDDGFHYRSDKVTDSFGVPLEISRNRESIKAYQEKYNLWPITDRQMRVAWKLPGDEAE